MNHEVLPGELSTFRAVGATGFGLGAAGGVALWLTQPEAIGSGGVAPPLIGAVVIAAAIQNMDGGRAVYDGFYLYVALAASYFLAGRQLGVVIAALATAAAVPLLDDRSAESIVRWIYVAAGTATMALVLRSARRQVRDYASQVRKLALVDQLTGALNRRGFQSRASAELSRARRHGQEFTLIYLDLDGFKQVNDDLGHAAGDVVLRRAAISMGATLRGEDVLARVGATTACATYPRDGETLDELMRVADGRLLARKRSRPAPVR